MNSIRGVITAMVTPFESDGGLDLAGARRLAAHLAANGSDGVVVAGTTGEAPTLDDAEKLALLGVVLEEIGDRATVICNTGSNDTRHSVELTRAAAEAGAHGVLAVTPYYNKPVEAGLRAHFAAISEAAGETPVVLYNIPSRSVINMTPGLMASLAAKLPNVVAVKQANNDDLGPIEGLGLLAGNDEIFARCLELGGTGGILVASQVIGNEMAAVCDAARDGDHARARDLDAELQPVYAALSQAPPASTVKAALEMNGLIGGTLRLPMVPVSDSEHEAIRGAMSALAPLREGAA